MATAQLSIHFFAQAAAILLACRLVGWAARRFLGQPQVVGEMIAGILLGPSLLGWLWPAGQAALFPEETRGTLYVLGQLGVGLYMFLVGLGFRAEALADQRRSAIAVSLAGMAAPFLLAVLIAPLLLARPGLFGAGVGQGEATLFLGAAIAITAFPMLARIIAERGLTGSRLGTLALSAGAIDDVAAWIVLALVLALAAGDPSIAWRAGLGAAVFAAALLTVGRRALRAWSKRVERAGGGGGWGGGGPGARSEVGDGAIAVLLILFALSAFAMDWVGIHAVFGGFLLGAVMPAGALADRARAVLEPMTVLLLLPFFFTYSGLSTELALLTDPALAGLTVLVLIASIAAKGGACWAAARATGQDQATATGVAALMTARGLMELILLNIGLREGIIGPGLFAMLVVMAVATTFMASPLFAWSQRHARRAAVPHRDVATHGG